jgi:hypothetical protein
MHVGPLTFCNGTSYSVKSLEDKESIMSMLKASGVQGVHYQKYPTSKKCLDMPHLISLRSRGSKYYLFLTFIDAIPQCIFIDEKVQPNHEYPRMILSNLYFSSELFQGTLFHGDMVCQGSSWTFLINDLILDRGRHLSKINLVKRINRSYEILEKDFFCDGLDPCKIEIKKHWTYDQIQEIPAFANGLPYETCGITFRPLFLKFKDILFDIRDMDEKKECSKRIEMRKQGVTRKFEAPELLQTSSSEEVQLPTDSASILKTFNVKKTRHPDVYEIVELNKAACIISMAMSKSMRQIFDPLTLEETKTMSLSFHERFQKWVPAL